VGDWFQRRAAEKPYVRPRGLLRCSRSRYRRCTANKTKKISSPHAHPFA
jgi:hypothetical protein